MNDQFPTPPSASLPPATHSLGPARDVPASPVGTPGGEAAENQAGCREENPAENLEAAPQGVGPWPGGRAAWPTEPQYDPELLEHGDRRNVPDEYRYWRLAAIVEDLDRKLDADYPREAAGGEVAGGEANGSDASPAEARRRGSGPRLEVAIQNLGHDFNIGSIVRTANGLGVRHVHIVGRRRWNRRGAMVTDRYLHVHHHPEVEDLVEYAREARLTLVGLDNLPGAQPLEEAQLPARCLMVFGEESSGISPQMLEKLQVMYEITQYGSTRSLNVGHAAAIALWAYRRQYPL